MSPPFSTSRFGLRSANRSPTAWATAPATAAMGPTPHFSAAPAMARTISGAVSGTATGTRDAANSG